MTRPVTPAEAREMLDGATTGPWRVSGAGDDDRNAVVDCASGTTLATEAHDYENRVLMAAAPALAENVASEPERIASARNALRAEVTAALAAFVESDHAVNRALAAGDVRDEYHPALFARLARLDALRGLLTPETTT